MTLRHPRSPHALWDHFTRLLVSWSAGQQWSGPWDNPTIIHFSGSDNPWFPQRGNSISCVKEIRVQSRKAEQCLDQDRLNQFPSGQHSGPLPRMEFLRLTHQGWEFLPNTTPASRYTPTWAVDAPLNSWISPKTCFHSNFHSILFFHFPGSFHPMLRGSWTKKHRGKSCVWTPGQLLTGSTGTGLLWPGPLTCLLEIIIPTSRSSHCDSAG